MVKGAGMWAVPFAGDVGAARFFDRLDQFFGQLDQIALDLDRSGRVRYINRRGAELLGHVQVEIIGVHWLECAVPVRDRSDIAAAFRAVINGEVACMQRPSAVLGRDGRELLVQWQCCATRDEAGHVDGTLSMGRPVKAASSNRAEAVRRAEVDGEEVLERLHRLTEREYEVLTLMVAGRRTKEIARDLGVSIKTIETHRTRVIKKMQADSLVGLVRSIVAGSGGAPPELCIPRTYRDLQRTELPSQLVA